jgi:hypothetical protein
MNTDFHLNGFYVVLYLIYISCFAQPVLSQEQQTKNTEKDFKEIISKIEVLHGKRIFYKEEWFKDIFLNENIVSPDLNRTISLLLRGRALEPIFLEDYIVIIPSESNEYYGLTESTERVIVGNPLEFGKTRFAVLRGKIFDGQTGEPLIGAVVYDEKTTAGASTNLRGEFALSLPVGDHTLRLTYIGYEESSKEIKLLSNGNLDFEIFEKSHSLDEVTIMAQKAEVNLTRTQMSLISIDSKMLKELPTSLGEKDIIRNLTLLPGIQSVGEFGTGFHVRGGGADQNLILIEDIPLFNTSHLFGLISIINSDMINNVTLMKAGIPAKYGERVSSVMDIRLTNKVTETKFNGGIGIINSRANLETPLFNKRVSLVLGARSSYSDWLLRSIPDADLMNSSASFYDLNGLISFQVNQKNILTIFGYRSSDGFNFAENADYNYFSSLGSIKWNSIISNTLSASFTAGVSKYHYQIKEDENLNPFEAYKLTSGIEYKTFKANIMYFPTINHSIDMGLSGILYNTSPGEIEPIGDNSMIVSKNINKEKAVEYAFYISDNFAISKNFSVEAGLRYSFYRQLGPHDLFLYQENSSLIPENVTDTIRFDNNEPVIKYGGLEPRINFRYTLNQYSSLKLSYNRVNQYINLISNTTVMTPADLWKLSDYHLKPLKSDQIGLGYFRNFKNNSIETSVELYYKKYINTLDYKNGARLIMNDQIETELINANGYNFGIELFIKKNSGRLTGWTSYTLSSSLRQTNSIYEDEMINDNQLFPSNYDKPHNLVMNTTYNISRRWKLSGTFTYNTGRPVTLPEIQYGFGENQIVYFSDRNKYRLPDYHRLDISISLYENLKKNQKGKGSWTFSIMNVYGRKNAYSVFYKKETPSELNDYKIYSLYKLYIIGRPLPTLTYNFTF